MGCLGTACEEGEVKGEVEGSAIKKREATEAGVTVLGFHSEETRPGPDEMDVVSLWQPYAENKLNFLLKIGK